MKKFIYIFLFSFTAALASPKADAEVSVVVHPSNASSISNDDIKRIFLGKMKKFPGGGSVIVINQSSSSDARKSFDSGALGKSANQIKAYWSKLVFSGKGNPPKEVANDQEVISLVKDNPAVIGYVDSASVTGDVKVIAKF